MKDYERYGIPDNLFLDTSNIDKYGHAVFYAVTDESPFDIGSADLDDASRSLWGAAEYWTALEASLLIAGLDPNHPNLYAVCEKCTRDSDGLSITTDYFWIHEFKFFAANENLFLFKRTSIYPEAPPIEWIKFYKQKIYQKSIQHDFHDMDGKKWLDYYNLELSKVDQKNFVTKQESTRKTDNLLRAFVAIAIDDYAYNPKDAKSNTPQEIADALSRYGVDFDPKTIRRWLKEGTDLLPKK
ncbi:hypothetical protein [Nitrosomonas marina]|uniref:Uncharacterized protein n=1 Tax=Nitrosomonas marina TaxID=917 RepID=A0A1H8GI59_9PROT|nr:hypothetical protein [Nitrosomonas marina]SEN42998.1 hypothetical protein SAMN05216325_1189 [Nitrosomonas marina]